MQGILYVLPSFILLLIFCIIPIFMSVYYSFTDYNVMKPPAFSGIANYTKMFRDAYFVASMKNTLIYVLVTVPFQTILSLLFAAFLASRMSEMRASGTTLLFVSHSMESVKSVCENALWLSHGKVMAAGPVDEVAEKYVQFLDEGNR